MPPGNTPTPPHRLDERLPSWAKRTNPIVQRHLGPSRMASSTELRPVLRLFWLQIGLIAAALILQTLARLNPVLQTALALLEAPLVLLFNLYIAMAVFMLPVALVIYWRLLLGISQDAASSVLDERLADTLILLRTLPPPLEELLLSKGAGILWQRVENLGQVMMLAAAFSLPALILRAAIISGPTEQPLGFALMLSGGLLVSLLRLVVEPPFAAALGLLAGAGAAYRVSGAVWTGGLLLFYFLLINLLRLLPLGWAYTLLVEMILPLALPPALTWLAIRIAAAALRRA